MRKIFFNALHAAMGTDSKIVFMTGDLGFNLIDPIKRDFPDRFYNMQAAEFAMVGAAIGFAQEGFIPVCYSITPFIVLRPFELLRTYLNHEKPAVKLIGAGRGRNYQSEGISHWADDIKPIMDTLPNIAQYWPQNEREVLDMTTQMLYSGGPTFMSLAK